MSQSECFVSGHVPYSSAQLRKKKTQGKKKSEDFMLLIFIYCSIKIDFKKSDVMSPSRLRLLALPTAPCKHGASVCLFSSFAWRENLKPTAHPSLHLKKQKVTSVTFDLCSKNSLEIHIEERLGTFNLMYNTRFSICDLVCFFLHLALVQKNITPQTVKTEIFF